jgi:hypothetical protein
MRLTMTPPISIPEAYPKLGDPTGATAALFDRPFSTFDCMRALHESVYEAFFMACAVCVLRNAPDEVMTPCVVHSYRNTITGSNTLIEGAGPYPLTPVIADGANTFAYFVSADKGVNYKEGRDFKMCP